MSTYIRHSRIEPIAMSGDVGCLKNSRFFSDEANPAAYDKQGGKCAITGEELPTEKMEADHIVPWSEGGKTSAENCHMLSKSAHKSKTYRQLRAT